MTHFDIEDIDKHILEAVIKHYINSDYMSDNEKRKFLELALTASERKDKHDSF